MVTVLYHTTHKKNVKSIAKRGLLLSMARNKRLPYIWLDAEPTYSLRCHVASKHGWSPEDMVTLAVRIPAWIIKRHPLNVCSDGEARKVRADIAASCIRVLDKNQEGWL